VSTTPRLRAHRSLTATAALLPLLFAVGCSGSSTSSGSAQSGSAAPTQNGVAAGSAAVKSGGTMTVALAEDPDKLDPTLGRSLVGREVFANFCQKLYDINQNLQIVPQLAAALPQTSADGKTVTIKIRSGVKFNDGTTMDAAAVKTTLDRDKHLSGSARATEIKPVTSVSVVDPTTVALHLSKPFAPLTAALADRAGMIMSPAQLAKLGANFSTDPICVGPFSFQSRVTGSEIVLTKAPDYYDAAKVKLDKIVFKIITDGNVRLANLKSGDVNVAERLAPTDVAQIRSDANLRLITATSIGYQGITINVGNANGITKPVGAINTALGRSPQLRQAFADTLDRNVINKVVFAGEYLPTCSPIPDASPFNTHQPCPGPDVAAAKKLVAASGVPTPIPVQMTIGTAPEQLRFGQVVQTLAKQAGFDVQLKPTEFASSLDQTDAGKFDTFQIGWSGRVDPDGDIYNFMHTGGTLNIAGLSDPAIDQPLDAARTSSDQATRAKDYAAALSAQAAKNGLIYLYREQLFLGTAKNVTGLAYYDDGLPRLETAGFTAGSGG
jgi:peptide/nickel transport system substrate-binding protein